jgi:hypothetical protein
MRAATVARPAIIARPATVTRAGTLLIIVSGISALLAMVALAFLVRMRSDLEESSLFLAETQARVMLGAALTYVAETSRIGWDDPATPEHEEAFGWVDVRDGRPGPRDIHGNPLFACSDPVLGTGTSWPAVGSWTICDARLWTRPPTAIRSTVAPNPIPQDPAQPWSALVGFPTLDPQPAISDPVAFLTGDARPLPGTDNPCWFRVYRRKPAVFIIACGAGSSGGYRSWAEVVAASQAARWGSQENWESQRLSEPMLWYEAEWNAAVNVTSSGYIYQSDYSIVPANISKPFGSGTDQPNKRNQMGTFLYLQRLEQEPASW